MATLRVATTRSADLQALGAAGQTTADAWRALRALLLRELSPAHAALLAEPVVNQARGEIDWYGEGAGEARQLPDLPDAERAAVQARLDALVGDIRALATRLGASRADGDRFLSEMLGLALQVPGPDWVRVVDGQPVLVGWGHVRAGGGAAGVTLTGRGAPAAVAAPVAILPPPPSPYAPAAPRRGRLWAALAGSLVAPLLAGFLLLRDPFGWFDVLVPACSITPGQLALARGLQDETAREGVLRTEMARLLADAGERRLGCPPERPPAPIPAPAPPAPPPPRPSQDAERVERQGGQRGKLQIILAWEDRNDLDLHVFCPNGTEISFMRRRTCGGALDVDANGDQTGLTRTPVENVFFNEPQPGRYRIVVDPYAMRERASTPFRVTIRREGQPDEVVPGTAVNGRHDQLVTTVQVDRP